MGQIVSANAKPKRCNLIALHKLSGLGETTPAAGEIILVSSDNSMDSNGCGNFDSYIIGDGTTLARLLTVHLLDDGLFARTPIDLSSYSTVKSFVAATGKWAVNYQSYTSKFIPVEPNTTFEIVANSEYGGQITFLKSLNNYQTSQGSIDYATGNSGNGIGIVAGTAQIATAPPDAHYLAVATYTVQDITPASISIVDKSAQFVSTSKQNFSSAEQQQARENIGLKDFSDWKEDVNYRVYTSLTENKEFAPVTMFTKIYLYAHGNAGDVVTISSDSSKQSRKMFYYPCKKEEPFTVKYELNSEGVSHNSIDILYTSAVPSSGGSATVLFSDSSNLSANTQQSVSVYTPDDGYICVRCYQAYYNYVYLYLWRDKIRESYLAEHFEVPSAATTRGIDADPDSNTFGQVLTTTTSNSKVSDYIDVSDTVYIGFTAYISSSGIYGTEKMYGTVFYDENKTAISAASANQLCLSGYAIQPYTISKVPDNAKYVRITTHSTISSTINYTFYKTSITDAVNNMDTVIDNDALKHSIAQAKFVSSSPTIQSLGLLHFSDIHGDDTSVSTIAKAISDFSNYITDVVCTGDVVHYYADATTNYPQDITWWTGCGLAEKTLFVLGNHDAATTASTEYDQKEDSAAWNGKGKDWCFENYFEPYISATGISMPMGYDNSSSENYHACYWHKDYSAQKIRLIGLDCMHRFDGVVNPETGAITTAGLKWTTNEQELWLIGKLNETLDSENAAYGYSVIFMCHYPLDDFSGDNAEWDDTNHKFIYNMKNSGGRVMSYKTSSPTVFHYENATSYTAEVKYNMRNRVDNGYSSSAAYPNYTKGNVNNVAEIIKAWMTSGGKYVAWLCGHTHMDYMWYPTNYPNMLCIVIDQAGCLRGTNTGDRSSSLDSRTCANYYSFDTQNGYIKIVRIGYTQNKLMNSHKYMCYDYINKKVMNEG